MRLRQITGRAAAAVLAASGMAFALAAPASAASPYGFDLTSGTLEIFDPFSIFEIGQVDFGTGVSCSGGSTADFDGSSSSGDVDITIASESEFTLLGDMYISNMSISSTTGTYSGTTPGAFTINSGSLNGTVEIYERAGSCTRGALLCTITAASIQVNGSGTTAGALPDGLSVNETATFNSPGTTTGTLSTSPVCEDPFGLMDGGHVDIDNLVLEVTSVS